MISKKKSSLVIHSTNWYYIDDMSSRLSNLISVFVLDVSIAQRTHLKSNRFRFSFKMKLHTAYIFGWKNGEAGLCSHFAEILDQYVCYYVILHRNRQKRQRKSNDKLIKWTTTKSQQSLTKTVSKTYIIESSEMQETIIKAKEKKIEQNVVPLKEEYEFLGVGMCARRKVYFMWRLCQT